MVVTEYGPLHGTGPHALRIWMAAYYDKLIAKRDSAPPARAQLLPITPPPQQQPQPQQKENDCMITASEYYARLEKMPWRNILGVRWLGLVEGHAYAAWKITPNGKVWLGDETGSFELETTSTKIEDVVDALRHRFIKVFNGADPVTGGEWKVGQ
jgi:hypothetical protein